MGRLEAGKPVETWVCGGGLDGAMLGDRERKLMGTTCWEGSLVQRQRLRRNRPGEAAGDGGRMEGRAGGVCRWEAAGSTR